MGMNIDLTASDGHRLAAYLAEPAGKPRGGIVVIQEIFGVTRHIRAVTDQYAAAGFLAVAPALFDRVERNVDVPYTDMKKAFGYMQAMKNEQVMLDVQAAVERVSSAGKVGVVGFCWGGTMAYLAAARLNVAAAVAYYGGGMTAGTELARKPAVPTMAHFGDQDTHISVGSVKAFEQAHPEVEVHLYAANHGFNCDQRGSYNAGAAATALERSLYHFGKYVG